MKKWIKRLIILTIICVVVVAVIINKPEEAANYRTTTVKRGDIETIVSGTGSLTASKDKKVYSKINGEISEIFYIEGDNVEERISNNKT